MYHVMNTLVDEISFHPTPAIIQEQLKRGRISSSRLVGEIDQGTNRKSNKLVKKLERYADDNKHCSQIVNVLIIHTTP